MEKKFAYSESELRSNVKKILDLLLPYRIWLLMGEMGSGKTTLVNAIAHELGNSLEVSSPTYTIVNEYIFKENHFHILKIFHLDLYRLNKLEEAIDAGIEEILLSDSRCIIEWPNIVLPLLQNESMAKIYIEVGINGNRFYTIKTKD